MSEEMNQILSEYPIYLRYGQMVELHERLGLGSEWLVRESLKAGKIERKLITGKRWHYTRSSVAALINIEDVDASRPKS